MCNACERSQQLLHDVVEADGDVANIYFQLLSTTLPRFRFGDFAPWHVLIGSTPPEHCLHLEATEITGFMQKFRSDYLQEI